MKTTKGISPITGQPFNTEETERTDSVQISLNAKGEAQVEVKCYAEDVESASARALTTFTLLLADLRKDGAKVVGDQQKA